MENRKVLIDMTHINLNKLYASLSVYVFRLLDFLETDSGLEYKLLILEDLEEFIKEKYPQFQYIVFRSSRDKTSKNRILRILRQTIEYKRLVNNSGCDVLFIANDLYPYTCIKVKPQKIVVIHDLKVIKEKGRSILNRLGLYLYKQFYRKIMETADRIIAISNYTKTDIVSIYHNICESKICVVYNGIKLSDISKPISGLRNKKYILYVNTLEPHKNIKTLIEAYALIDEKEEYNLVVVGKKTEYWNKQVLPIIEKNNLSDKIIRMEGIEDAELRFLYENATLFVTPSLREGFGYTPIEAAIYGCPVISSKCEALPDTTRGKVIYYNNPIDYEELVNVIDKTLKNLPDDEELKRISEEFKMEYSCEKQVRIIENILKKD